jgi:DNA-binding FadR family transcriptional regulator
MSDLYEFRRILEVSAARLAAQNAGRAEVREFKSILRVLENLIENPENRVRAVELDLQVHELIARASGNSLLLQASRSLLDKLKCLIWVDWLGVASATDPVLITAAHRDHHALISRILEKDGEGAAVVMGAHVDKAREGLEKKFQDLAAIKKAVVNAK